MKDLRETLERLGKWRSVFGAWQLGTRLSTDPEMAAVKDHREITILLRVEVTALTRLLLEKGVCTQAELQEATAEEAEWLNESYERRFPGMKATDMGIHYDLKIAAETMRRMNFKP